MSGKSFSQFDKIPLFYWSKTRFQGGGLENYGDLLSLFIVEKLSGREVVWTKPYRGRLFWKRNKVLLGAGSIIQFARKGSVVWGSGIISREDPIHSARFLAVRGPLTRERVLNSGFECPKVYGDPGLLLPVLYPVEPLKSGLVGLVPHYVDYKRALAWNTEDQMKVIPLLTSSVQSTTREICGCELVLSSSLHGLIIAHAYSIPAVWIRLSDNLFGDDVKFEDYFRSVGLTPYQPKLIKGTQDLAQQTEHAVDHSHRLPDRQAIQKLQEGLMRCKPF